MGEERRFRGTDDDQPDRQEGWRVDEDESIARAREERPETGGGMVVYIDEHGRRRRLPADMSELTREDAASATAALSSALGGAPPDQARLAAIERLTELRASGRMSEEDFKREKRRIEGGG